MPAKKKTAKKVAKKPVKKNSNGGLIFLVRITILNFNAMEFQNRIS